jgi:DNA-binding PadR family transcriptional regulator
MNMGWHGRGCGRESGFPRGLFVMGPRGWSFGPGGNFHFEFGEGPGGWSGRGRGGRRRMFGSGELRLVLLKLIADEPRHGYDLIRAIEELTHGDYAPSPGVVYPTLSLLADEGLVEEQPGEGARKRFAVTEAGRAHLAENGEEVARLFERLEETGSSRRRTSRPEIGRAVGNLMAALRNRAAHEGWNEELLDEVTDILDDAAKRIERLR